MILYLVQHGEAKREEEDPNRGLTEKGIQDVRKAAAFAHKAGVKIARIVHSGKTRAVQTAELFADVLVPALDVEAAKDLAPNDDPAAWAGRIAAMQEDLMLVGHLPFLAKLAGLLLCDDQDRTVVSFKMGGIVCLRRQENGSWAIAWMVVPDMLA